jgi:hypothetical protein
MTRAHSTRPPTVAPMAIAIMDAVSPDSALVNLLNGRPHIQSTNSKLQLASYKPSGLYLGGVSGITSRNLAIVATTQHHSDCRENASVPI